MEWYDPHPPTNQSPLGVQFWLALTNGPGSLARSFGIPTPSPMPSPLRLWPSPTPAGSMSPSPTTPTAARAVLYTNGQSAATVQFPTNFVPRTSGDLYLGFDPTVVPTPSTTPTSARPPGLTWWATPPRAATFCGSHRQPETSDGNAWAQTKQPCASGFDTSFQFRISNPGSWPERRPEGMGSCSRCRTLGPTIRIS